MTIQDSSKSILNSLKKFLSGTAISKVTGLMREVTMAIVFGTTPAVAAFWMAFRFANLLRRLFGEGALHTVFVPHFETLRKDDPKKGSRFFYDLSTGLTFVLLSSVVIIELVLATFCLYGNISRDTEEILKLTMILLPSLIFISLYALNSSLLQCEGSYFLPSVSPSAMNIVWIVAVILLKKRSTEDALEYLSMIIVFAFALQWIMTMPHVLRYFSKFEWQKRLFSLKGLGFMLLPFLLGMAGVAATQVNSALDSIFARIADPRGPAFLWYALKIQQLPLALFGIGLTSALLPPISRAHDEMDRFHHFLSFACKKTILVMAPISLAIVVFGLNSVSILYGHGNFDLYSIKKTTLCLWSYGAGLLPMTLVLIFATAFYAKKNYKIPAFCSLLTVGLNVFLNAFFVFICHMDAISIAISTSISSCANAVLLATYLYKKYGFVIDFWNSAFKVVLTTCFAASLTLFLGHIIFQDNSWNFLMGLPFNQINRGLFKEICVLCSEFICFVAIFVLAGFVIRIPELTPSKGIYSRLNFK